MSKSVGSYIAVAVVIVCVAIGTIVFIISKNTNSSTSSNSSSQSQSTSSSAQSPASSQAGSQSSTAVSTSEASIFNARTLAQFNGKNGNKCYVAVDGNVYDMTGNRYWQSGEHQPSGGQATCGLDLSSVINQSPHGKDVLNEVPKIGSYR